MQVVKQKPVGVPGECLGAAEEWCGGGPGGEECCNVLIAQEDLREGWHGSM